MTDTAMKASDFEQHIKSMPWMEINRPGIAEVAERLFDAANHIEQVGWVQHMNYADPANQKASRCCAIGALHVVSTERTRPTHVWVSDVNIVFKVLHGMDLIELNDFEATQASDVTTAMRKVAQDIRTYLEETSD